MPLPSALSALPVLPVLPFSSRCRQLGFTLLEVLVALALFAGISAAVVQIFASGVDVTQNLAEETQAYLLAESKMDEILLLKDVHAANSGTFPDTPFHYTVTVSPQTYHGDTESRNAELLHIELTVNWGEGRYRNQITLEALKTQQKPTQ